jgi:ABC-type microcin C transport system duplicated ATPase subunit YejF
MTGEILVADDIEVVYGARNGLFGGAKPGMKVLHGVSLRIGRGETVGIVGESGSGKTTLGRALLRLVDVAAGQIRFDGAEITRMPEAAMRPLRPAHAADFSGPDGLAQSAPLDPPDHLGADDLSRRRARPGRRRNPRTRHL